MDVPIIHVTHACHAYDTYISSHMHVTHVTCTTQITDVSFVMLNNSPIPCVMVKIYSCTSKRVCFFNLATCRE